MGSIWIDFAAVAFVSLGLDLTASAQEVNLLSEGKVVEAVLGDGLGNEAGQWKSKVVQALVPGTNNLETREYQVLDFEPGRALDFMWQPSSASSDRSGKITGFGRLVWREHGRLAWDASGVVETYTGEMSEGVAEGAGELVSREGFSYAGAWRAGRPEGDGTLQLPSGESYTGQFKAGFAEGQGEFIDTTGERFEGAFHKGLREGQGKTTLPSGFSYTSVWDQGREEPGSRRIRLAQLSGPIAAAGGDDIRLGVTVQRKPDLPQDVRVEEVIYYASTPDGQNINVAPANKNLVSAWKGNGDIESEDQGEDMHNGIFYFDRKYVDSTVPTFVIDIQNRSKEKFDISAVKIDVEESRPDNEPAIQMLDLADLHCGSEYSTSFRLDNFGWSPAKNARIDYSFVAPSKVTGPVAPGGGFAIGDIADRKRIDFDRELARAGANVEGLKRIAKAADNQKDGFPCPGGNLNECLRALKNDPRFGKLGDLLSVSDPEIDVKIAGKLQYSWVDDRSELQTRTSPFHATVHLGHFTYLAECGEGAAPEPIAESPIHLKLSGSNYTLSVPFHRTVDAGQTARLTVRLDAEKSSNHKFRFVAALSNGREVTSRPVNLLFYRPRPLPKP